MAKRSDTVGRGMEQRHAATPVQERVVLPRRFAKEAVRVRIEAEKLPPGIQRREREALTAAPMDGWLKSPGLQSSK